MLTIDDFIKIHLKKKNMRIETFIKKCEISKSTFYRVAKGYQKASTAQINTFIDVLQLNTPEIIELKYLNSLFNTESNLIETRKEIEAFIFKDTEYTPTPIDLIYYNHDQYIRNFDRVLSDIFNFSTCKDFKCSISILNSQNKNILTQLYNHIKNLNPELYKIEHLVSFSSNYKKENVIVFQNILNLLTLDSYNVLYNNEYNLNDNGLFSDFMYISYSYLDDTDTTVTENLAITFSKDAFSQCLVIKDSDTMAFLERGLNSLYQSYKNALNQQFSYGLTDKLLLDLESKYSGYMIKSSFCFDLIPFSVYEKVMHRFPLNESALFLSLFFDVDINEDNIEIYKNQMMAYLKKRYEVSYLHKKIDVVTKSGLEEFAKTGRLSDHPNGLIPFSKEEVKDILLHVTKRDKDSKDSYNFHIIDQEFANNDFYLIVYEKCGIMCEIKAENYQNYAPKCIFLENEELNYVFIDFIEKYVSDLLALSSKEKDDFITYLIETYC